MAKSKKRYPKTFRPPIKFRTGKALLFLVLIVFLILFLVDFLNTPVLSITNDTSLDRLFSFLMLYLMISFTWYLAEYAFRFAVIVTPEGIWFHGYGKRFYTWDSMTKFSEKLTFISRRSNWGIKTRKPKIVHKSLISKIFFGNWIYTNFIPIVGTVYVPSKWIILRDKNEFKTTELGQELFYFAPHLFDTDKKTPKNRLNDAYHDNDYDIVEIDRYQQEDNRK